MGEKEENILGVIWGLTPTGVGWAIGAKTKAWEVAHLQITWVRDQQKQTTNSKQKTKRLAVKTKFVPHGQQIDLIYCDFLFDFKE